MPYCAFAIQSIGPERALHFLSAAFEPKPDKVVEVPVRHPFHVEEDRDALELKCRNSNDMDLLLFESQGPQFVVVSRDWGDKFGGFAATLGTRLTSASPWAVAIRHLRYRKDSLCITFRPLLAGHRRKQAQIVVFDGESATPRLEV